MSDPEPIPATPDMSKGLFGDFWRAKKDIIQFASILTGIGALFLAIPKPDNVTAAGALANIQFIWLLFITFGVLIVFINLWLFILAAESKAKNKFGFRSTESISLSFFGLIVWFLINIWKYTISLYEGSLAGFLQWVELGLGGIVSILTYMILLKIKPKISKYLYELSSFLLYSLFTAAFTILYAVSTPGQKISLRASGEVVLIVFAALSIIVFGVRGLLYLRHKLNAWRKGAVS
jgi:hypothetical protein